jgi:hypothetical protein
MFRYDNAALFQNTMLKLRSSLLLRTSYVTKNANFNSSQTRKKLDSNTFNVYPMHFPPNAQKH